MTVAKLIFVPTYTKVASAQAPTMYTNVFLVASLVIGLIVALLGLKPCSRIGEALRNTPYLSHAVDLIVRGSLILEMFMILRKYNRLTSVQTIRLIFLIILLVPQVVGGYPINSSNATAIRSTWESKDENDVSGWLAAGGFIAVLLSVTALGLLLRYRAYYKDWFNSRSLRHDNKFEKVATAEQIARGKNAFTPMPETRLNNTGHPTLAYRRAQAHYAIIDVFKANGETSYRDIGGNLTRNANNGFAVHVCFPKDDMNAARLDRYGLPLNIDLGVHNCQQCPERKRLDPCLFSFSDFYLTPAEIADQVTSYGYVVTHDFVPGYTHNAETYQLVNNNQVYMSVRGGATYQHGYNLWENEGTIVDSDGYSIAYRTMWYDKATRVRVCLLWRLPMPSPCEQLTRFLCCRRNTNVNVLERATGPSFFARANHYMLAETGGVLIEVSTGVKIPDKIVTNALKNCDDTKATFKTSMLNVIESSLKDTKINHINIPDLLMMLLEYQEFLKTKLASHNPTLHASDRRFQFDLINAHTFVYFGEDDDNGVISKPPNDKPPPPPKPGHTTEDRRTKQSFPTAGVSVGAPGDEIPSSSTSSHSAECAEVGQHESAQRSPSPVSDGENWDNVAVALARLRQNARRRPSPTPTQSSTNESLSVAEKIPLLKTSSTCQRVGSRSPEPRQGVSENRGRQAKRPAKHNRSPGKLSHPRRARNRSRGSSDETRPLVGERSQSPRSDA
jgi:hypothetical protein